MVLCLPPKCIWAHARAKYPYILILAKFKTKQISKTKQMGFSSPTNGIRATPCGDSPQQMGGFNKNISASFTSSNVAQWNNRRLKKQRRNYSVAMLQDVRRRW